MKKRFILAAVFIFAGALALPARSYKVVNNFPTGEYVYIKPANSNLCLGVTNSRRSSKLELRTCRGSSARWKFVRVGNGKYRLKSARGGYLRAKNSRKRGSRFRRSGSGTTVKFLVKNGSTFHIKKAYGKRVLDVSGGKTRRRGADICLWDFHGKKNQQWRVYLVRDRKYFNYYRERSERRRNRRHSRRRSSSTSSLDKAFYNDYQLTRYFRSVNGSQLRNDDSNNYLLRTLNGLKFSKRLIKVQKIVEGVRYNSSTYVRSRTFRKLTKVNLRGGNFIEKMVKNKIKGEIRKAKRRERSNAVKRYMDILIQNLR